ncbi:MAG TPA: glycoside hydrolase family 2 protein [Bacteroidia bacterium]
MKASVPGTVHTDLLANKKIPDPFYGNNEKDLQWIENEDWEYKTVFSISKKDLRQSHIELQFDGLDTYAKVYVNDSLVIVADNMFRKWNADIKKYIHRGKNSLSVVFESAVRKGKEEAKKLSYVLPGEEKVFTRKAQYQYGWDWGPRFVTCGIWKNVRLSFWNDARILSVKYNQNFLNDSLAMLDFICEIQSDVEANAYLDIVKGNKKDLSGQITTKVKLQKGIYTYPVHYTIKNPHRWWSNGLGLPTLYDFEINLSYDSRFLDMENLSIGLRTIELIQEADSAGSSFYFKLNGIPVFMKGANFIPPDNFLPRVPKEQYGKIIQNAVDANMNMLRVWGGGVYADEAFYKECDQKGILVWQDFMFACAMYPGDDHFIENIAEEVIEQTERLRNHPCIALWCGNNEVDEGWKNWGWQKQYSYSQKDSAEIANNNAALFEHFIKDMVNTYDGSRPYWPSSPSIGWGHKESLQQGDSHYWGVWWGMEPFEMYEKKVGRFMSEYGFQGMPGRNNMYKSGLFNEKLALDSAALKNHQKHPTGYQIINSYMDQDYKIPSKPDDYAYVSQLLQAEGLRTAIEAHRRAEPYCMGTMYWQLNDCWPATSWSSVDYYNEWKAAHYKVKHVYQDVIISLDEKQDYCNVYVISDLPKAVAAILQLELFDLSGNILSSKSLPIIINADSSGIYYQYDKSLIKKYDKNNLVLKCSLTEVNAFRSNVYSFHYFLKPKFLNLQKPKYILAAGSSDKGQFVSLQTDVLMKDVCISIDGDIVNLSDNYFDLLPGEIKTVYLPQNLKIKDLEKKIRVKSLADTY